MDVKKTARDKGLEFNVRVKVMDDGLITLNGSPLNTKTGGRANPATAIRFFGQMIEEAIAQSDKRLAEKR